MNISRRPRCENTFFEFVVGNLTNADYPYSFAQCKQCKTVVGVVEHGHVGYAIGQALDAIKQLSDKIDVLSVEIVNLKRQVASMHKG